MGKLVFYYGTMGAGKTTELIKTYNIYRRKGLQPIVIKPNIDTREGVFNGWGRTSSRITKQTVPAYYFKDINDISALDFKTVLVDEAQFLSKKDVLYLSALADRRDLTVLCYGLRTDVNGDLFKGAGTLMALADDTKELENLCQMDGCSNKAQMHLRFVKGEPDTTDTSVVIESDDVTYKSVCRKCWQECKGY